MARRTPVRGTLSLAQHTTFTEWLSDGTYSLSTLWSLTPGLGVMTFEKMLATQLTPRKLMQSMGNTHNHV